MEAALIRLGAAIAITGALVGAYRVITGIVLARAARNSRSLLPFRPGTPGVVFFTTADCLTCKAAQRPALEKLANRMPGSVQVIEVDAGDNAALARQWSVLSVPTTFVLDRDGTPRQVNHGFASTEKLLGQIIALGT